MFADAHDRAAKTGLYSSIDHHSDLDRVFHSLSRQGICGQDVGWLIATATPDSARPMPSANRMPPTPVAAARKPASAGKTICPTRLPVIRNVNAVPQTSGGERYITPEKVSVEAIPIANPKYMRIA